MLSVLSEVLGAEGFVREYLPVVFNWYISVIYVSLALLMRDKLPLRMFLVGCSGIHFELGLHNLIGDAGEYHEKWHMMAFDLLQIVGGTWYFLWAYKERISYIKVSFLTDRQEGRREERDA